MPIRLNGETSGSIELDVPAAVTGGDITLTLPATDGTADQVLQTNGSGSLSFAHLYGPAVRAKRSTDLEFTTNGAWVSVPLNATDFDTDNCFNTTTGFFTPNKAGIYHVSVQAYINYSAGSPNRYGIRIYKNGSNYHGDVVSAPANFWGTCNADTLVLMNGTTDYLSMAVYLLGATAGQEALGFYTNMSAYYVRPE